MDKRTGKGRFINIVIMLVMLLILSGTAKQVYADVSEGSRTIQTESEGLERETDDAYETIDFSLEEQDLETDGTVETGKIVSVALLSLLILALILFTIVIIRLLLIPNSGKKLERLLAEYKVLYDAQHRYYAYCAEELIHAERLGTVKSFKNLRSIRQDVAQIYNERIENELRVEAVKESNMSAAAAVRAMKKILRMEKEHLRRLENYLRKLREENTKSSVMCLSAEHV